LLTVKVTQSRNPHSFGVAAAALPAEVELLAFCDSFWAKKV
jgi:hypothetical protein